mmetsp:Transcript_592/g.775  ORF Transcript_592/g.775 Transcript_592/m.775 type:complete len:199 (+) Transcript_592:70-666(+)|eukprot:CAMPEP_0172495712 /NCGR_PEP_ID=MMETSP1066-20121228/75018_1 /TAXON_ID=671091 /ORGANISM="Coscinodiscus wailesii, Strain CCMP2513" /LENGTH=198 /DNA_ID=CAMNT_0013267559 /DNA_START=60 /DNA_END=656 /DNA_ORIENTATION=+
MKSFKVILVSLSLVCSASCFGVSPKWVHAAERARESTTRIHQHLTASRRTFLATSITASIASTALFPTESFADVSDGDLPAGAAQFARILRTKSDLVLVRKRIKEASADEISKEEWDNVGKFLRKVYTAAGDMKKLGISDPAKKKRAIELTQLLEKLAQAGDIECTKEDKTKLLVILDKAQSSFDEFFDLLSDVPDEI